MGAKLVYQVAGSSEAFALEQDEVTVGRSAACDLSLADPGVSRRHARLFRKGGRWHVEDLGSSNGTRVNGRAAAGEPLRNGDRIAFHTAEVRFVDDATPATVALTSTSGLEGGTILRSAIDFAALASGQAGAADARPADSAARLQRLLSVLAEASKSLLASPTLEDKLGRVLDLVFEHLRVERGCVLLWDDEAGDFVTEALKNKSGTHEPSDAIRFSRTIAEKVYREKVGILTSDAQTDERFAGGASIMALGIRSAMAAPLWNGDKVEGLIYVDTPLHVKAFDEFDLDLLSALGNHVAVAIDQSRMQESMMAEQVLRRRLERYHSPNVVERIAQSGGAEDAFAADQRMVTVMFADVVGFTTRCEGMEPHEVAAMLNRYFSVMAEVIFRHNGTLDKFIGDCVMAVFGAPFVSEGHAVEAAAAALEMREALETLNEPLPPEQRVQFRVGMHSGAVIAGDIGSIRRRDYTVLGSTVNLAARLESGVAEAGQIVVSDSTWELVRERFDTRFIRECQPKGIRRNVPCYELVGRRDATAG